MFGISNLYSFGGIAYLYFLPPYLKEPEKLKKISMLSVLITGIYLILCVSIILFMFTSVYTTNEVMPLYSAARNIDFGTFLQRLESLFLLVWIVAFISYLSIACKFSTCIFKKITNIETTKPLVALFGLIIFSISLIPKNMAVYNFLENTFYKYFVLGIVFILGIGILLLAYLKEKKKEGVHNK